jgi:cytochrome c
MLAGAAAGPAAAADSALGEYLSHECVTCHQLSGRAAGAIPPIVGWPPEQFVAVMQTYRDKQRDNAAMQAAAGRLTDDEIGALAAFFAAQPVRP